MNRQMPILLFGALAGVTALAGCQSDPALSDRFVENKGAEAFLEQIAQNCGDLSIGSQTIGYLFDVHTGDAYIIDETSKLYFGKTDQNTYSRDIKNFYPGGDNQAGLACIFEQLGK